MKENKKISLYGIGIALYVVISTVVNIPLINRIRLDLGYIIFAIYLNKFGISSSIVGLLGCIIANLLKGGSFPIAWSVGQIIIGISLGCLLPKTKNMIIKILYSILFIFIGIAFIKTLLEVWMYDYQLYAKFSSNFIAYIADLIPFIFGILLSDKINLER